MAGSWLALSPIPAASSTIQTVSQACYGDPFVSGQNPGYLSYECPFIGGISLVAGVAGGYFDYSTNTSQNIVLNLIRISNTGAISTDAMTVSGSLGQKDVWVPAVLTKQNPNPTDYWSGRIDSPGNGILLTGMALVTN